MNPENITNENKAKSLFFFENLAQHKISNPIDQALEKTCLFEFTETHGPGMIPILLKMK